MNSNLYYGREYRERFGYRWSVFIKMLSAFAIESFADNYDINVALARLGSYTPGQPYAPSDAETGRLINKSTRISSICSTISSLEMAILNSPANRKPDGGKIIMITPEEMEKQIDEIFPGINEKKRIEFEGLYIAPVILNKNYALEKNLSQLQSMADSYGADELKSVVAVIMIDGDYYLLFADAIRYGDNWYLSSLIGNAGIMFGLSTYNAGLSESIPAEAQLLSCTYQQ